MPSLFTQKFVWFDVEYELDLDVDDAAIMDGQFALNVSARSRPVGGKGAWQEETLRAEFDWVEQIVTIKRGDLPLKVIDIRELMEFENSEHTPEGDLFDEGAQPPAQMIEEIIQMFPTDPFIGCLLKAGLSTGIGQAIRCYGHRGEVSGWRDVTRHVFRCMKQNGLKMLGTAAHRVFRCSLTLGAT